jgi:hypothetical protein
MEEEEQLADTITVDSLRQSSHSDWIGLGLGTLTFFVGFLVYPRLGNAVQPAAAASIVLLVTAFVAGLIAGVRTRAREVPESLIAPSSIRWGGRTGLVVFLAGSGFMAIGLQASYLVGRAEAHAPYRTISASGLCLGCLLVLLPTVVSGAVGTYLGLARTRPAVIPPLAPASLPLSAARPRAGMIAASCVFVLGCLLSGRTAPSLRPSPDSAEAGGDPPPAPKPIPEFSYKPPVALATAPAGRWRVVASRSIPGLSLRSPVAPSTDGRFLAYAGEEGSGITVFDFRKGTVVQRFATQQPAGLAWSPGGDRLFYIGARDSSCWVLNRSAGSATLLPVRGLLPFGSPQWKSENEVFFGKGAVNFGRLDLDTLTTRASRLAGDQEPAPTTRPVTSIVETEKCRVTVRPMVRSFAGPLEAGTNHWEFDTSAVVFVEDKDRGHAFPLLDAGIHEGATFIASPDASTITVLTESSAVVLYMGIDDEQRLPILDVALPKLPDLAEDSPLASMTKSGRVYAFVCAPLVNPLNRKVIGPDPRHVKALGFLSGWPSDRGSMTITESYSPISNSDVAGYIHHWDNGQACPLLGSDWEHWWSPTVASSRAERAEAPYAKSPWREAVLLATQGGIVFDGFRPPADGDTRPTVTDLAALTPAPKKPRADIPSKPRAEAADETRVVKEDRTEQNDPHAAIRAFVTRHHAKVRALDLEGFVADYAETVDFNDKGLVTADFIRKDQAAYMPRYDKLSETLLGGITVTPTGSGWQASYTIRSYAISKQDGKVHDHRIAMELDIRKNGDETLRIFRERATREN